MTTLHTVQPDSKGRITLGKLAKGVESFGVTREKDGRIILEPMVSIPKREMWLYQNKKALKMVLDGIEDAKAGRVKRRPSYAKYASVELD